MKTQIIRFAILVLISLLLYPMAVGHSSSPPDNSRVALPQSALGNHNVMLRVVRVTPSWMPFASTDGWTSAVPKKESEILKFYEAAIWEETSSVHFYEFPNNYDARYGYRGSVTDEEKIAYREQFLIKKYTGMSEAWTNERSTFLKSAFMDIVSYIVNQHPNSDHHLMYSGHGGPGGALLAAQLNNDHAYEFLNFWRTSLGRSLGVIDMGGPCTKGSFADLDNFCESARYYVASDLPNGGYTMNDWTIEKYDETTAERQYHNLFFTNPSLEETLKDRIDLKRKAYEYSRNNMITNQVAQANYLYSCAEFRKFSLDFKSFLSRVRVRYSIFDDLYQYMINNNAPPTLIEQFNKVIVHKADNKDFFEWSEIRNGILMPKPGLLVLLQPNPDFNDDGAVGISDFLLFVEQFGLSRGDAGYDARFDLDGDGSIGISDFLIFVDAFGKKVSSSSRAVTIPDANLRAAIEAALGKASGAPVTLAEMETLTLFSWNKVGIRDLTGLESATNLRILSLANNNITDISALTGLAELTGLYLWDNKISDLAPLVANAGLGSEDVVKVTENPLNAASKSTHIPALLMYIRSNLSLRPLRGPIMPL